jgi:RecB family exonuclease
VISPRRTRLLRVRNLRAFQQVIVSNACSFDPGAAHRCAVIVPSAAAAGQLQRTAERWWLERVAPAAGPRVRALVLPDMLTREGWYARMYERLPAAPALLSPFDREVLFRAAAGDAVRMGCAPPFHLRPGLIVEMLGLYDALRRRQRSPDIFERSVAGELEPVAEIDRGAERMLRQTRFLVSAFRAYEARLTAAGCMDEHELRLRLLQESAAAAHPHVMVTVGDIAADRNGLWPADFDLLARLPGLERLDVVATEELLEAGLLERVHALLPGIEEERVESSSSDPVLIVPGDAQDRRFFTVRDREEELAEVVRSLKTAHRGATATGHAGAISERTAFVFKHPLPYLYLARQVFRSAGVPYQTMGTLPLAAEPYAAVLDLVWRFVTTEFSRAAGIALLRSPHLKFAGHGERVSGPAIAALDRALREMGPGATRDRLSRLAEAKSTRATASRHPAPPLSAVAANALALAAQRLAPLGEPGPPSEQVQILLSFLREHEILPGAREVWRERHLRARAAILDALEALGQAFREHDDTPGPFEIVVSTIRRWIESKTFAPRSGQAGVQLVDSEAVRYGDFDEVQLAGLVESEWPARERGSIFYPHSLLSPLGWHSEIDRMKAGRAAFRDLLRLPRRSVSVSTFALEDDVVVSPSWLLEDLEDGDLAGREADRPSPARIFVHEALTAEPVVAAALQGQARAWLALRMVRTPATAPCFHGWTSPRSEETYTVGALDRYLDCPFKYFAARVLRIEEEAEDEATLSPLARGRFIHEIFHRFLEHWQTQGGGRIGPEHFDEAREAYRRVVTEMLDSLPECDRALEGARLLGSPVDAGWGERVLRLEAERPMPVIERLLEYRLEGEFELAGREGARRVRLRGIADRLDLLGDGTFRLLDYKSGKAPAPARAIQLPVYSICAEQRLAGYLGGTWQVREAGYVAFGEAQRFVSMVPRSMDLNDALAAGQERAVQAVDGILAGVFPPRPASRSLCAFCAYPSVCRKDYVDDE